MDKKVILAVAGSGKTSHIIDQLDLVKRQMVITYTVDNCNCLKKRVTEKFGYIPPNIVLMTYFSFLYSFCFLPILGYKIRTSGVSFETIRFGQGAPQTNSLQHYVNRAGFIYHNRLSKLLLKTDKLSEICARLDKYYDDVFVDEIQDFGSYDFDLILGFSDAGTKCLFVGDFFQHTFETSTDGAKRKNLYKDYDNFRAVYNTAGFEVDTSSLLKSHRCGPAVCEFVSTSLGIAVESHREDTVSVELVDDDTTLNELFHRDNVVKLFYQQADRYPCLSRNWGNSKGNDSFHDVCVILTSDAQKKLETGILQQLAATTKNKLYVACTRAKGNLYLVPAKSFDRFKI